MIITSRNMTSAKGGQPPKLTEEVVGKAEAYVRLCEAGQPEIIKKSGYDDKGGIRWSETAPRLPNLAAMFNACGVHRTIVHEWKRKADWTDEQKELLARFFIAFTRVEELQEQMLVEEGSSGRLSPQVVNRILAAKHGYMERLDHTTKDKELPTPLLASVPS